MSVSSSGLFPPQVSSGACGAQRTRGGHGTTNEASVSAWAQTGLTPRTYPWRTRQQIGGGNPDLGNRKRWSEQPLGPSVARVL